MSEKLDALLKAWETIYFLFRTKNSEITEFQEVHILRILQIYFFLFKMINIMMNIIIIKNFDLTEIVISVNVKISSIGKLF